MFLPDGNNGLHLANGLGINQSAMTREGGILFYIEDYNGSCLCVCVGCGRVGITWTMQLFLRIVSISRTALSGSFFTQISLF